jgi:hypothetical protein
VCSKRNRPRHDLRRSIKSVHRTSSAYDELEVYEVEPSDRPFGSGSDDLNPLPDEPDT